MNGRDDIDRVREATDLVRLVGDDIAIKPRGREFVALCPFHEDSNPSMTIVPQKQIYHCFVCKAGGNAFSWMMNYHKMTFRQAMEHLASRAGITLTRLRDQNHEGPSDRERILDANSAATRFYRALLKHPEHGTVARQYIEQRGISAEMQEQFQIGYAADRWDGLATSIPIKGWNLRAFELAGLVSLRQNGEGHYDRLRHRIIFPICDALGRPIAFGGRKIRPEDEPKYLNSPETAVFNKSATLFGLHLAKQAIIASKAAVIVEGYTDVIACHQAGVRNVVATLGTALTVEHVGALKHYAEKVILIYDADEAGQRASDRALEVFLSGGLDVLIAVLPDQLDPADLLSRENGLEVWHRAVASAAAALDFQFARVRQRFEQSGSIAGREAVAREYLAKLGQLGIHRAGAIRRALILQRVAALLHLPEQQVDRLIRELGSAARPVVRPAVAAAEESAEAPPADPSAPEHRPPPDELDYLTCQAEDSGLSDVVLRQSEPKIVALAQAERNLIGCLLRNPQWFHQPLNSGYTLDEAITPADVLLPENRRLYAIVHERLAQGMDSSLGSVLADLAARNDQALSRLVIQVDAEVDAASQGDPSRLAVLINDATEKMMGFHRDQAYLRLRQELVTLEAGSETSAAGTLDVESVTGAGTASGEAGVGGQEAVLLRRVAEHNRTPNPARILRGG